MHIIVTFERKQTSLMEFKVSGNRRHRHTINFYSI